MPSLPGGRRERIDYLPNFVPDARAAAGAARRPATPHGAPLALALGRLHPNKGFDLLLAALARMPRCSPGDRRRRAVARRARAAGRRISGSPSASAFSAGARTCRQLLANADLLVCPSLARALGQYRDRGVVGRIAGGRHRQRRARRTDRGQVSGLLVPLPDQPGGGPLALAAAIERVVADPGLRARLGQAGRRAYEAEFTEAARRRPLSPLFRPAGAPMCGIAGLMTHDGAPPPAAPLRAMGAALRHRGPDGDGQYRSGDVGMVQTRLAIIDLATGDQPLYEPGGAALIANAEIYNYIELREELHGARPLAFSTQSDCELPLHLYRRHGLDFTQHLRGMYAMALHDPARRAPGAGPRSVRHQAALLCRDAARFRLRFRAGGADRGRHRRRRTRAPGAQRAAANAVHHRARDDLRRHQPRIARRDAWSCARAGSSSGGAARPCPITARSRSARTRRWPGSTPPLPTASASISAPTCRTACSCRAASIRPRCWR